MMSGARWGSEHVGFASFVSPREPPLIQVWGEIVFFFLPLDSICGIRQELLIESKHSLIGLGYT